MAWTLVGEASSPADNGASTDASPSVDISGLSPAVGDLVVLVACRRGSTSITGGTSTPKFTIFDAGTDRGGLAWNSLPPSGTTNATMWVFLARYTGGDGTYTLVDRNGGTTTSTLYALLFRPSANTKFFRIWAERQAAFAAPGSPYTVSIASWNTATKHGSDSHLNLAFWLCTAANTWDSLSGTGWSKTSLSAQIRNTGGSDLSLTAAYSIQTSSGATNAVAQNESAGTAGCTFRLTISEYDAPAGPASGSISTPPTQSDEYRNVDPGSTVALTLGSPVVSGSAIVGVIGIEDYDGNATGDSIGEITDDQGNVYLQLHRMEQREFNQELVLFALWNITNGPQTITATISTSGTGRIARKIAVHEVPGIAGFDKVSSKEQIAADAFNPEDLALDAFTPSQDGAYLFYSAILPGDTETPPFFTWASPFTQVLEEAGSRLATADNEQTTAASVTPTVTLDLGRNVMGIAAAFTPVVDTGQTVAVNQVSETDTAQAVARLKTLALGQPEETDTAQAATVRRTWTLGQPEEIDTPQAVGRLKALGVAQLEETDTAQALTAEHQLALGEPAETDLAQTMTMQKGSFIAQVAETNEALGIARLKVLAIGQPEETDEAQAVTRLKAQAVAQALEGDWAQIVSAVRAYALGQASETDLAQTISESGVTMVAVALVTETDLAQAIAWAPKHRTVAQAIETDLAQAVGRAKAAAIGQAIEADLAQVISGLKGPVIAQVTETDLAQPVAWSPKFRLVGQALETDTAFAVTVITPGIVIIFVLRELTPAYTLRELVPSYTLTEMQP